MRPTLGSLFAGIGGIDLGFERAGFETVWQVEINPYCRKVLARHFPNAERYEDVRGCCGIEHGTEWVPWSKVCRKRHLSQVDVIAGGFPCQDVSLAGLGAGLDGDRSGLWFEMRRLVRELRPKFLFVENVSALLVRGFGRVLADLAEVGYDAEWDSLQAGYFGAPHERERVFILAYPNKGNGKEGMGAKQDRTRPIFAGCDCPSFPIWLQTADCFIGVDDGVPAAVYGERVGAVGNSVVPQIPELIANRIRECLAEPEGVQKS